MSGLAGWAVQTAVYAALDGNVGAPVYDDVPAGAEMPYVLVGECLVTPNDMFGRMARDVSATLHVWSDYAGLKEAQAIADSIDGIMLGGGLAVSGYTLAGVWLDQAMSVPEPGESEKVRHLLCRYKVTVFE